MKNKHQKGQKSKEKETGKKERNIMKKKENGKKRQERCLMLQVCRKQARFY